MAPMIYVADTGERTSFPVGCSMERMFFRVMPLGGTEKVFYSSRESYVKLAAAEDNRPAEAGKVKLKRFLLPGALSFSPAAKA